MPNFDFVHMEPFDALVLFKIKQLKNNNENKNWWKEPEKGLKSLGDNILRDKDYLSIVGLILFVI